MNKTRFQLPRRTSSPVGVDGWVTGESAAWPADTTMPVASTRSTAMSAPMKSPFMFDMAALLEAQRCNIESITAANRVLREGAQAVARQNLEVMQRAIDGFAERVQMMSIPECPRDRAMRQTETAIKAYEDAAANLRVLSGTIQHANAEAIALLTRRCTEAADEVKSLARRATSSFWDSEAKPATSWQQSYTGWPRG